MILCWFPLFINFFKKIVKPKMANPRWGTKWRNVMPFDVISNRKMVLSCISSSKLSNQCIFISLCISKTKTHLALPPCAMLTARPFQILVFLSQCGNQYVGYLTVRLPRQDIKRGRQLIFIQVLLLENQACRWGLTLLPFIIHWNYPEVTLF